MKAPIGVIAGAGALPRLVAEAAQAQGAGAFIVALRGAAGEWIKDWPHSFCGLGQVGRLFASLRKAGCRKVCLAGGVTRPSPMDLRLDFTALRIAPKLFPLLRHGDDALLRGVAEVFEKNGFELIGAHELLDDLLAPAGALGAVRPDERDLADVARAAEIVAALGAVDVGQGAIVARGRCLAVETVQGTDAMLKALSGQTKRAGAPIPSGALYKAPKPGQDLRMDLPTIGPETVKSVKAAGLNGVAVQAGSVFILDPAATAQAADDAGVFVVGWEPEAAR